MNGWSRRSTPRSRQRLRELPDVATWIGEASGADSPRAIHWAVQQLDAAGGQLSTGCIHIVHRDRELESRPGVRAGDNSWLDEIARGRNLEQIDQRVLKPEYSGVRIFIEHRKAEHIPIEELRLVQILDEKCDGVDAPGRRAHLMSLLIGRYPFRPTLTQNLIGELRQARPMRKVTSQISISLDGFVAGPNQSLDNPIGEGGMRLHDWLFPSARWRRPPAHGRGAESLS